MLRMLPFRLCSVWLLAALVSIRVLSSFAGGLWDEVPVDFTVQDVEVNSTVVLRPVYLENLSPFSEEIAAASRARILGWSRIQHVDKFYYAFRVKIEVPSIRASGADTKVHVCFDQDPMRSPGNCRNGSWRAVENSGTWTILTSPFENKYVDIRVTKSFAAPPVLVSVQVEKSSFRLLLLVMGLGLLTMAPIVSAWVPFYYGTAMTLGALMIVLVILYQAMKLLPTGRKSTMYIVLYGSMAGLGTVVLRYFTRLVSTFLWEMGVSEDMYNPIAVLLGVSIALIGAWLGYLGVRKLLVTEDGNIDQGVSEFVKWALRILGYLALVQSSSDYVFITLICLGGYAFSWAIMNLRISVMDVWENLSDLWSSPPAVRFSPKRFGKGSQMTQAQIEAVKRLPGSEKLILSKGILHRRGGATPGLRKTSVANDEVFLSTFHKSPGLRASSQQEYADVSRVYSNKAVSDLMQSEEFATWRIANKDRVVVLPHERRQERPVEEIQLTAYLEEGSRADMEAKARKGFLRVTNPHQLRDANEEAEQFRKVGLQRVNQSEIMSKKIEMKYVLAGMNGTAATH